MQAGRREAALVRREQGPGGNRGEAVLATGPSRGDKRGTKEPDKNLAQVRARTRGAPGWSLSKRHHPQMAGTFLRQETDTTISGRHLGSILN